MFSVYDVGGKGGDLTGLCQPVSVRVCDFESCISSTVVERFAEFAHAHNHSDELWSLVVGGSTTDSLIHGWESFSASTRKENLKTMYFKSGNAGSH